MKKYWKSLEELKHIEEASQETKGKPQPEFSIEGISTEEKKGKSNRRDFLKMLGFTVGYATLASSCEMPVRKAIPYLSKPEEVTPGEATYYASSFFDGKDYCSLLVKVREGRPIKVEGNELSKVTQGGTNARVQASVLNLYDTTRLKQPLKNGEKAEWETIDSEIKNQLQRISSENGEIVLLTSSVISPSMKQIINEFTEKYPSAKWVVYDTISNSAMLQANEASFGKAVIPSYHFDKASVVVSFNADFLGSWLSSIQYTKDYSKRRKLTGDDNTMSRHIQFESMMSLTGSNADERHPIKPSEENALLLALYNEIAGAKGEARYGSAKADSSVVSVSKELLSNQGKSLVVCGSNDPAAQRIVNAINYLLGNYGSTIDLTIPLYIRQGRDEEMHSLIERMNRGEVKALITANVNPAYTWYDAEKFEEGINKVDLSISTSVIEDETAALMTYVCPDNNYLESWGDTEPVKGHYSLCQPTIPQLFDSRQLEQSLLIWSGNDIPYYDYLKDYWKNNLYPQSNNSFDFEGFWTKCLHDGIFEVKSETTEQAALTTADLSAGQRNAPSGIELVLYESIPIGNGQHANNPWLQELPDPITKATWDNYVTVSPKYAEEHDLENEDVVSVNGLFELPVIVQPGQAYGTIAIAVGYGRKSGGRVANNVGKNAYPLSTYQNGHLSYSGSAIELNKTGEKYPLALTQAHHTMEGRPIVRETTLAAWKENPDAGNELHDKVEKQHVSLYDTPEFPNFHWGMAVNLNSCIGCGACEIACQAENNVAVIGKEEVRKRRIMHWIRIDRYYSDMSDNPEVFHQPVMCQHCDNAPCENVCPVAATPHSNEGLNMMAYNRCIGTRYCMNNCPYRVRRFNWYEYVNNSKFPYNMDNQLGKMTLNPDVVVRSRGVVEKCTFCSQRLQDKKLLAKREGRKLQDGEVKVACQEACPADAIEFGDLNNKDSRVSKAFANPRNYHLLEELHTLPSVGYLTKVRNKTEKTSEV